MVRSHATSLPPFTPDRLLDRIAEAMQVGTDPAKMRTFPPWTQRVMRILKEQFIPPEFADILLAEQSAFAEGVAVAMLAGARDVGSPGSVGGQFAQQLAERLAMDRDSREVAVQVGSGTFAVSEDFQRQIINRMFASDYQERRAFTEGLAIGGRLPELFDGQARRGTTDATGIYLVLWFYWPEISRLNSIGEVAKALEPLFAANKNLAGAHWAERIRKLANRIGLSFRARQTTSAKPKALKR